MSEYKDASRALRLTADMIAALAAETERAAGAPTELVSVTFDMLGDGAPSEWTKTEISIVRVTKTLVFSTGETRDGDVRLMAATAVHKIVR